MRAERNGAQNLRLVASNEAPRTPPGCPPGGVGGHRITRPIPLLARALRGRIPPIADAVARAFERMPKWQSEAAHHEGARADYLEMNFHVFPVYAADYFERADETYLLLFIGELIKALYVPDSDAGGASERTKHVLADLRERLGALEDALPTPECRAEFSQFLDEVTRVLTIDPGRTQRILFVGDCLFLDIVPFIVADLLDRGIRLVPDYATSKNPGVLGDQLRTFSAKQFDLVFYSPFTYEFSPQFSQLLHWRKAFMSRRRVDEIAARAWEDARGIIDVLADLFDCPIHVHNTAAVVREEHVLKRLCKAGLTARIRSAACARIDAWLSDHLAKKNAASFQHLFVFDERIVVRETGEIRAGGYFHQTPRQHPAVLGRILSRQYVDLVYVNAWLLKRKVVVCDLDNTVWEGVIGEGPVTHHHDRQRSLKALKSKGVLLAINSKNDPANVHWRGGTLGDDDFAHAAISWEPKVHGMQRIQSALNLKIKDYVFVDDRADERDLMQQSYPDTVCLDATDPDTWRRIALWGRLLEEDPEMDRTLMYKQREARKSFIREDVSSPEERARLFELLELRLTIRQAQTADLKRIAELINRTNQFNLEGSRTTFREVSAWHDSPDHVIVLGLTADRFGAMGVTCIAVAECAGTQMRILPFVLSCRVFGYGIERSVMNYLKQIARERGMQRIVGRYQATPQNAPCKDFLADNGFVLRDGVWSIEVDAAPLASPPWLAIETL